MTMRSTLAGVLSVVGGVLLAAGCSSVSSTHPLSAASAAADREKFEGVWLLDKSVFTATVASNGVIRAASVEWKDEAFRLVELEAVLTEGKTRKYLSIRSQEDGQWTNKYFFVQYKFTDQGDLILWPPNVEAFEGAVTNRQLRGVLQKDQYSSEVTITNAAGELLEFIEQPAESRVFLYTEPMVLRKIAGPERAK